MLGGARLLGRRIAHSLEEVLASVDDDHLGIKRLAGEEGRALLRAAAAFRAGVEGQQVLPRPLRDRAHAEVLGVLEIDWRQLGAYFWRQLAEEDIGDGHDDVQVFRAGDVDEEGQYREDVHPVEDLVRRNRRGALPAEAFEGARDQRGYRPPRRRRIAALRDAGRVLPQHPDHDGGNQSKDDQRVDLVALLKLAWPDDQPVHQRHQHADQHQDAEQILEEGDPGGTADQSQAEGGEDALAEGLDDRREEDDEAVKDEEMKRARIEVAEHAGVEADVAEHTANAFGDVVEAILSGTQAQDPIELARPDGEVGDGGEQDGEHGDRLDQRHLW